MDGERGYAAAAGDVRDAKLKMLFQAWSSDRSDWIVALQRAIGAMGAFAENEGSAGGLGHRGWMAIRHAVETGDRAILEECERGDKAAVTTYDFALARLPHAPEHAPLRGMLEAQRAAVLAGIAELRDRLAIH
jgi:uncharacterized protein (TIGR02284 family)